MNVLMIPPLEVKALRQNVLRTALTMPGMIIGLGAVICVVAIGRHHTVAEHPESLFIRVWKQGTALEVAEGLRFALDVERGAAKVALNSGRE